MAACYRKERISVHCSLMSTVTALYGCTNKSVAVMYDRPVVRSVAVSMQSQAESAGRTLVMQEEEQHKEQQRQNFNNLVVAARAEAAHDPPPPITPCASKPCHQVRLQGPDASSSDLIPACLNQTPDNI